MIEPPTYPEPEDHVFPGNHTRLLNGILKRTGLKKDRHGNVRTAYSLRHTYICFRLLDGANVYSVAKNCRTSVEIIEKHYATHIKHMLDASEINVRKPKRRSKSTAKSQSSETSTRSLAKKGTQVPVRGQTV